MRLPFALTLPHCEPTNAFLVGISSYFHKCFPTPLALISVAIGICSIFCWLAAQIPQIHLTPALPNFPCSSRVTREKWDWLASADHRVRHRFHGQET